MALAKIDIRNKKSRPTVRREPDKSDLKPLAKDYYTLLELQSAWLIDAIPELKQHQEEFYNITVPTIEEISPCLINITSGFKKLKEIADKIFINEALLLEDAVIKAISEETKTNEERAKKGLELMYWTGIATGIISTEGAAWFLSTGAPF